MVIWRLFELEPSIVIARMWPSFSHLLTLFGFSSQDVHDNPVSINLPAIQGNRVETRIYNHNHFHVPTLDLPRLPLQLQQIAIYACCILCITIVSSLLRIAIVGDLLLRVVRSLLSLMIVLLVLRLVQIVIILSRGDLAKLKIQYLQKLESPQLKKQSGSTSAGKQAVVRKVGKDSYNQKFEEINHRKLYSELIKRSRFR